MHMPLRTPRLGTMLLLATCLVAVNVPVVYAAHLRPTILFAVLAYLGWGMVAVVSSAAFADKHLGLVLTAAIVLELLAFLAPAGLVWLSTRAHPGARKAVLCAWGLAYLALLYAAFPAGASA